MSTIGEVIVPVFGTVALGYGLARGGLFGHETGTGLVRFMYYLAIPAMLFRSLAAAELPSAIPWSFLAAFYLPSLVVFLVGTITARRFLAWSPQEIGIAGMVSGYSNMVLLGFPLVLSAFGAAGAIPMFILLATQSTFIFPLTTYTLEMSAKRRAHGIRAHVRTIAKLGLNPVILSLLLGVYANLADISLPGALARSLELLSAAGPACALVALGISLAAYKLSGGYRDVVVLVALKNIMHPLLVWLACTALGIVGDWFHVAILLAAMPVGINAFIFASQYAIRQEAVAKCIVVSTALSSIVITLLLGKFM